MALTLITGPANAGKVNRLLEKYLGALDRDPILIVPNRSDSERVERELLRRTPALLGGSIGTLDDLFDRIAEVDDGQHRVVTEAQRVLVVRRAIASSSLEGIGVSARSAGFADALAATLSELGSALIAPDALDGQLAALYRAYRTELERLGLQDRELARASAVRRLATDAAAWHGEPVFAYGFEDLTQAEWEVLNALAGRADVTLSLPYEPNRPAFAALQATASDIARFAGGRIEELPPSFAEVAHPAIAHLERGIFTGGGPHRAPPLEGAVRFLEAAGRRGVLERVGEEILDLVRGGIAPERIGVVCPSLERWRAPVTTAFGALGIPHVVEAPRRFGETAFGHALLSLVRYAWLGGERTDLFAYLRSPFSGVPRSAVDFVEGRLRGRAITAADRVDEEMRALRGASLPALDALRVASSPVPAVRGLSAAMMRAAFGLEAPPVGDAALADLRAHEACARLLDELQDWEGLAGALGREEVAAALERATVRFGPTGEPGRVAVLDLMRARTRQFEVVFVLGLEEGTLPRRGRVSPFLDDDARRRLSRRLERRDQASYDRYLFYTACTRATRRLYFIREAATEEGSRREPSPLWEEVAMLFAPDDVERWTGRRPLSALTWPLERAPTERERLRALAALAAQPDTAVAAEALARANGWERRLERARTSFRRRTRLRHPLVLEQLRARSVFNVTELERFADCSSAWLVERFIDPRSIDAEVDARLRGGIAHNALYRFFSRLGRELGTERVERERVEDALALMRACLDQSLEGVRMDMTPMQRRELEQGLWRDLEQLVHEEAASGVPLVPRQFEVSFGSERSAPELQRGLELGDGLVLSGKIDRIDVDPFSARGIVQDYKAGKGAHSARSIERELRLQIPLYMLVLRDLVGLEPLGGVYRPLAGDRKARGLLRADAREDALPGFVKGDYADEDGFWRQVEGAKEAARRLAGRIREGDVRHDPRGGECPAWCDLWRMCRVQRP